MPNMVDAATAGDLADGGGGGGAGNVDGVGVGGDVAGAPVGGDVDDGVGGDDVSGDVWLGLSFIISGDQQYDRTCTSTFLRWDPGALVDGVSVCYVVSLIKLGCRVGVLFL